MKYCKKCLTTNLRPNALFNEEGICIPCEYSSSISKKSFIPHLETLKSMLRENRAKRKKPPV